MGLAMQRNDLIMCRVQGSRVTRVRGDVMRCAAQRRKPGLLARNAFVQHAPPDPDQLRVVRADQVFAQYFTQATSAADHDVDTAYAVRRRFQRRQRQHFTQLPPIPTSPTADQGFALRMPRQRPQLLPLRPSLYARQVEQTDFPVAVFLGQRPDQPVHCRVRRLPRKGLASQHGETQRAMGIAQRKQRLDQPETGDRR